MGYYPIFLQMDRRRCIVIGGGAVAERKVQGLLESGADVTVISPEVTANLKSWAGDGKLRHVGRSYQTADLQGAELVFAAADDQTVNAEIHRHARARGVWVNAADDPSNCDFILPAVIRRGRLSIAVSTGGASPAAARAVREHLEAYVAEEFAEFVEIAAEVRRDLQARSVEASAESWNRALSTEFRNLVHEGRRQEATRLLLEKLGAKR